jgi:mitogen-activated protein kinase organizer 1
VRFAHSHGDYLLSGGQDRSIQLWNPSKAKHVKSYAAQHGREVHDVQLTSNNEKFASASGDKLAMLWDVSTGDVIRRFRAHEAAVNSCSFNEDDSVLATASYDQTVRLWDVRSFSRDAIQTLRDAKDSVSCVRIRGTEIAAASMDGCLRRYDLRNGQLTTDHMGAPISSVAWSHDGEVLLVSCLDGRRRLIDKATGAVLNKYEAPAKEFAMEACFDNTDGFVIGGGEDGIVRVWDLVEASEVHRYLAHDRPVTSIAWHPREKQFASASVDGTIRFWK